VPSFFPLLIVVDEKSAEESPVFAFNTAPVDLFFRASTM